MKKPNIEFFDRVDRWVRECPDKAVAIDAFGEMSYAEMDRASARVYGWLKAHGIGREDFVMIHLPRSARIVAAVHGIFKAGAAYVICPLDFPAERYEYIFRDCGCRLELTQAVYDEMMACPPLPGRETADPHDAAYAVYTSGTTGMPKGAVQEYGNLDQTWKRAHCNGEPFARPGDIYGLIASCNFAAFSMSSVYTAANGAAVYLAPREIVKNPHLLRDCFERVGVTIAYFPSSFLRVIPGFNRQLKKVLVSSELARGIYFEKPQMINAYSMSEACCMVATFLLDRAYDVPPIGKPQIENGLFLIDGELCFESRYFRGYVNRPDLTAQRLIDGIYHTGDMGMRLEDGNFVVTGRRDQMIKIAGNRVMPGEVEVLIKRALNVTAVVRGFQSGDRAYLCAYYTGEAGIDPIAARQKLLSVAPGYMIPTYYVRLDAFPRLPNGKLNMQLLAEPDIRDYRRAYAAPVTDAEKRVCEVFQQVLKQENIGIHDDFFELGGDSLRAIEAVIAIDSPEITSAKLYELRTARRIAGALEDAAAQAPAICGDVIPAEEYAQYMLNYQAENPASTWFNVHRLLRIDADADGDSFDAIAERLARALGAVCAAYDQLHSVFVNRGGKWYIQPAPDMVQPCAVERMRQSDFEVLKPALVQPFAQGELPFRFRLIRTEDRLYFFYDFFHAAIDGTAIKIFRRALGKACCGEPLDEDAYLRCRLALEAQKDTEVYARDKAYLEDRFSGSRWAGIPLPDRRDRGTFGKIIRFLPPNARVQNEEVLSAVLRAIAKYNNTETVMATWTCHSRDTSEKKNSIGLFIRDIPAGIHIRKCDSKDDIRRSVRAEIADGIAHMGYQWALTDANEAVYTVTQGSAFAFDGIKGLMCVPEALPECAPMPADNPMDMEFFDDTDGKYFVLKYNTGMYDPSSADKFAGLIAEWF